MKAQFQSRSVSSDPEAAKSLYVADLPFDEARALRRARAWCASTAAWWRPATPGGPVTVLAKSRVPDVGDRAPKVNTPTKAQAGGDIESIDTRQPPSSMHEANFADVVGKKPVVLLFATPALCQSRVCGPVVDIAEQVKANRGDEAEFIHQEIFVDNEIDKGFRPQVLRWRLPTEPWVFTVDRNGRVAARHRGRVQRGGAGPGGRRRGEGLAFVATGR